MKIIIYIKQADGFSGKKLPLSPTNSKNINGALFVKLGVNIKSIGLLNYHVVSIVASTGDVTHNNRYNAYSF